MPQPVGDCCVFVLFFVALWIPPLAVIGYQQQAKDDMFGPTTKLNLALFGGAVGVSIIIGVLQPVVGPSVLSWNVIYLLAAVAGLLGFAASIRTSPVCFNAVSAWLTRFGPRNA
ncbi:hypothetical protein JCM11491_001814 [Sporobolomyces phaffii]